MVPIIVGHLVLSCLMAFIGSNRINKQERLSNFIISLFFPVGGYISVLILYLLRNKSTKEIDDEPPIEETVVLFADRINVEKETNIVPLEEILLINDTKIKRQQLIDTLKKDFSKYLDMLKIALKDEDVETSHYAASAVSEIKRNLDLKFQALSVQYEKNKSDMKLLKEYAGVLEEYLNSSLLDETSRKKILITYVQVLKNILKSHEKDAVYCNKLINALFEAGELEKSGTYCKAFLENNETEDAYLINLKYYYLIKDKSSFDIILKKLKKSSVKLSNKGINIVRFWSEGV